MLFNIKIIQVYALTSDKDEGEIETFYSQIKKSEMIIVMGDFNVKVGQATEDKLLEPFGLGQRNQRGDRLVQFCSEKKGIIAHTIYKLPLRWTYTWMAPANKSGNIVRNLMSHLIIIH